MITINVNTFILVLLPESVATPLTAPVPTKRIPTEPVPWHPTIWLSGVNDTGASAKYAVVQHWTARRDVVSHREDGM
jgi:hypothetical protein